MSGFSKLRDEGYRLKNEHEERVEPFTEQLMPGESAAVVLEQTDVRRTKWPPTGIVLAKK